MGQQGLSEILTDLSRFAKGAHHPHCDFHHHHIVRPFGRPLCLGCFCMWSGVTIGLIAVLLNTYFGFLDYTRMMLLGVLMVPFPFIQVYIQRRVFKMVARTALGFGSAVLLSSAFLSLPLDAYGYSARGVVLICYVVLVRIGLNFRSQRMNDPCNGCSEGAFPLCTWKAPEIQSILETKEVDKETGMFLTSILDSFSQQNPKITILTGDDVLLRSSDQTD